LSEFAQKTLKVGIHRFPGAWCSANGLLWRLASKLTCFVLGQGI